MSLHENRVLCKYSISVISSESKTWSYYRINVLLGIPKKLGSNVIILLDEHAKTTFNKKMKK